jgi:hypothetical protein
MLQDLPLVLSVVILVMLNNRKIHKKEPTGRKIKGLEKGDDSGHPRRRLYTFNTGTVEFGN